MGAENYPGTPEDAPELPEDLLLPRGLGRHINEPKGPDGTGPSIVPDTKLLDELDDESHIIRGEE